MSYFWAAGCPTHLRCRLCHRFPARCLFTADQVSNIDHHGIPWDDRRSLAKLVKI